ncbi:MAG: hypothetical protein KDB27_32595 [Planctomycetales bacterium]|nr:hypothetical protein [Planctomycetales bacterium]
MMNRFDVGMNLSITAVLVVSLVAVRVSSAQNAYLDYDANTGHFALEKSPEADYFTTFELVSRSGQFLYDAETDVFYGVFDVHHANKLFKLEARGFGDLDFGKMLSTGLPIVDLASDLCVNGSLFSGGPLTDVYLRSGDQELPICKPGGNPLEPAVQASIPLPRPKPTGPPQPFFLDYDPATGTLTVDSPESILQLLELSSRSDFFSGEVPDDFRASPGLFTPSKMYIGLRDGFQLLELPQSGPTGLAGAEVASRLCYSGNVLQGGGLAELYVRSGGETVPVACGAPTKFDVATSVELNATADVGVVIEPNGGNLIVYLPEDPGGASKPLTRLEITADKRIFAPANKLAGVLAGPADVLTDSRLLKVDSDGFGTIDFGPILRNGELVELSDLTITAQFATGEAAKSIQFVNLANVPEAQTSAMALIAAIVLFPILRRDKVFVVEVAKTRPTKVQTSKFAYMILRCNLH